MGFEVLTKVRSPFVICCQFPSAQVGLAIMLWIRIREFLCSNLNGTGYSDWDFSWVSSVPPGEFCNSHFLPSPLQFIITDSVFNYPSCAFDTYQTAWCRNPDRHNMNQHRFVVFVFSGYTASRPSGLTWTKVAIVTHLTAQNQPRHGAE
jgi:hypothetical protein